MTPAGQEKTLLFCSASPVNWTWVCSLLSLPVQFLTGHWSSGMDGFLTMPLWLIMWLLLNCLSKRSKLISPMVPNFCSMPLFPPFLLYVTLQITTQIVYMITIFLLYVGTVAKLTISGKLLAAHVWLTVWGTEKKHEECPASSIKISCSDQMQRARSVGR